MRLEEFKAEVAKVDDLETMDVLVFRYLKDAAFEYGMAGETASKLLEIAQGLMS